VFANPLPSADQVDQFYSPDGDYAARRAHRMQHLEAAHARDARRNRPPKPPKPSPRDILLDALAPYVPIHDPPRGAKVLDVGCGDGKFLNRLQHRGCETYGIEPGADVAFYRHRRLESPPQDGRFDFVVLHQVLEHVTAPLALLHEVAGATREGGVLFVSVPRLDTLPEHRDFRYCINSRTHLLSFSETCLKGLLARSGFAVTARLDATELDDVFTDGKPLRLRVLATRTSTTSAFPAAALKPAATALARYARTQGGVTARLHGALPVRLRAALLDRARGRRASRRARISIQ
jgi:SAM-dependent methyltransferase